MTWSWRRRAAAGLMALGALVAMPSALRWSAAAAVAEGTPPSTLLPPLTVPSVTVPPVTLPPLSLPPVSLPGVEVPPVTLPPVSLPPVSLPGLEVPPLTLPGGQPAPAGPDGATSGAVATPTGATTARSGVPGGDRVSAGTGTEGTDGPDRSTAPSTGPLPAGERSAAPPPRLRQAAADTARQLSFPIGLVLALAGFLLFQDRVDRADPRVAARGELHDDELLQFS